MRLTWLFTVVTLMLLTAGFLRADLPGRVGPPGPPLRVSPDNAVPIVLETRDDVTEPRLEIPRALLAKVKVAAREQETKEPFAQARTVWLLGGFALFGLGLVMSFQRRRLALGLFAGVLVTAALFLRATPAVQATTPE